MKKCFFSILSVFFLLNNAVFAKIFFDKLDLNQNDELLYTVTNEATGISKYNALFKVKVKSEDEPLFYPEKKYPPKHIMPLSYKIFGLLGNKA